MDMEISEMGSWVDIALAYLALDAALAFLSGKLNAYGGILY